MLLKIFNFWLCNHSPVNYAIQHSLLNSFFQKLSQLGQTNYSRGSGRWETPYQEYPKLPPSNISFFKTLVKPTKPQNLLCSLPKPGFNHLLNLVLLSNFWVCFQITICSILRTWLAWEFFQESQPNPGSLFVSTANWGFHEHLIIKILNWVYWD